MKSSKPILHARDHMPGGADPIPGIPIQYAFYDAMMKVAATRDLRGYWRLGDGGYGPYLDSSGRDVPVPMTRVAGGVAALVDQEQGALFPHPQDDGCVEFTSPLGAVSGDYLKGTNIWGTGSANPFDIDAGTIVGIVKAHSSPGQDFHGGIFSMLAQTSGGPQGYALGVQWMPDTDAMLIFHDRGGVRLYGPMLPPGGWVVAAAVKDDDSTRIYLNGALVASGPPANGTPGTNLEPMIGLWNASAGASVDPGTLYGLVDEVSVWADALTDDEIALLAAAGGLAADPGVRSIINTEADYTAHPGETVLANGTFTVTLPTAVGIMGQEITIKNTGFGTITVGRTNDETIDGVAADDHIGANGSQTYVSDGSGWVTVTPAKPDATVNGSGQPGSLGPIEVPLAPPTDPNDTFPDVDWIVDEPFTWGGSTFVVQPNKWTTIPFTNPLFERWSNMPTGTSPRVTELDWDDPAAAGWINPSTPRAITIPHDMPFLDDLQSWWQICLKLESPAVEATTSYRALRIFETTRQHTLVMASSLRDLACAEGGGINVYRDVTAAWTPVDGEIFASGDTGGLHTGEHDNIMFMPNNGYEFYMGGGDWLPKSGGVSILKKGMRLVPQVWHDATVALTFDCANPYPYRPHFIVSNTVERSWGPPWSDWVEP